MNDERLEFLYNTLRERSLVDPQSDFEQFRGAYSTTDRQQFLYDALKQRELVDPNSTFTQFQSAYFTPSDEVKKKDTATQADLAMAGGPDTETAAIPGVVGDLIRSVPYFGDFVDDIYRAGSAGLYRGQSTTEIFKGAFGGELDEDDYNDIVANMRTVNQYGQSDEAKQFQKEYQEADGFFERLYIMASNPTAMGEVMVGSIAQMLSTVTEAGGVAAIGTGAAVAAPVGLLGGPFAEVTVPAAALRGAVGALSGATDATATALEIINEELYRNNMELTEDNLRSIFENEETVLRMRNMMLERGVPIAIMDAFTMGVSSKVVGSVPGVKGTLLGGGVEVLGAGAGEAAAQITSGQPLNQGDILLEAAAEGPMVMTSLVTKKRPSYTIDGQKVSRKDFEGYINSDRDLTKAEVKNDKKLEEQLQQGRDKQLIFNNLPDDMLQADKDRAVELEAEKKKLSGSTLSTSKRRVAEIDKELDEINKRYFEEGKREPKPEPKPEEPKPEKPKPEEPAKPEDGKKMRRFSQRVARNVEELRQDIINNPNSYYDPQVYEQIRERLADMTHEDLLVEMRLSGLTNLSAAGGQIGVMAGIERINRALAEGDFNTVNSVQEELSKIGTSAGQILRQFGELRTSTPDNLVSFIEAQMKQRGKEMNEAQRKRISDIANRYMQAQAQYKETIRQLTFDGGLEKAQFDALEAQAEEQQNRIGSIEREIDTFSNTNIERGWGDIGSMLIQGNLLTPMSQVTNIFANAVNATMAIPRDIAAKLLELPTRAIAKAFGKETQPAGRQFSISAYLHGARQFGRGISQSAREAYTGETSDVAEWRMQRGFAPQRSLLALLAPKGIAVERAKRKGVEVDSPLSSNQKAKLWVQSTFGVPAEIMFRLLSLGDTPFRRYMEGVDIYQAALDAGVTKDKEKLRQFLKYPPRKVLEAAQESGRALTFQQETAFSRNAQRAINGLINYAEQQTGSKRVGDFVKFVLRSNVPYIKTPANILLETLEYAFLPLAAVKGVMKSSRGDVRGATQSFAKGFIGYMIAQAATELIKQGLISGEPEWGGDEAEKNLAYDQFPPSSINVTGLQRYLAGGDPSVQPGDVFRSYKKLGIPGVIMGAKTMIPVDELPDDKSMLDNILDTVYRSTGTLNYFLDQSFIQGINNLLNVLTETDPDRVEGRVEKWLEGTMKAMMAAPLPNTLSAVHRAEREFLPDVRVTKGETTSERLYKKLRYTVLDRTFSDTDVPVRINWKGLPIQQTPPGASAWQYNLLDVTKARQGEADPVSNEIYRLFETTDEVSSVVSTPSFARSSSFNVPKLTPKQRMQLRRMGVDTSFADDAEFKESKIAFSVEQLNQLMQVAGQQRYADVQELINSPKYARMSDEERLSALDKVAGNYNQRIEYIRPGRLADHSVLLMQFIQQLYDARQNVQGQ